MYALGCTCMHAHLILEFFNIYGPTSQKGFHSYFFCMLLWIASVKHTRVCLDDPIHYIFVINLIERLSFNLVLNWNQIVSAVASTHVLHICLLFSV